MGSKRKPENSLKSEPSPKIRRISTITDLGRAQDVLLPRRPPHQAGTEKNSAPCSVSAPLTRRNLRRLEKITRSRGTKSETASDFTEKTGTTSTTDPEFEAKFRANHGVSVLGSRKKALPNRADLDKHMEASRDSASPTSSQDDRFVRGLERCANERDVEVLYHGRILKDTNKVPELEDLDYCANIDKQWVAFPKDVGFNNGLSAPKPDLVEGYAQRAWPPTIKQLGGAATLVKHDPGFTALPHFAGEFKDFGKSVRQGEVQAGYDGAATVYARHQALAAIGQKDPPGRASPVTMASDGRTWRIYAHSAEENVKTKELEYFQHQIAVGDMTENKDIHRGRRVLRNAQDWGRQESTDLQQRMQKHYETNGTQLVGVANATSGSSRPASRTSNKKGPILPSAKSPALSLAPSGRSSDTASVRDSVQSGTSVKRVGGLRPLRSDASNGSSKSDGKQRAPLDGRSMPPPPGVAGRDDRQRPQAPTKGPLRPPSSASSASRSDTPKSSNAPVASGDRRPAVPQGQPADDNGNRRVDRSRNSDGRVNNPQQAPARGRDQQPSRDQARYRDYRARTPVDEIEPVQRRRSDSPQDKISLTRRQDRERVANSRDRDHSDDRRYVGSSASGSSNTSSTRTPANPPKKAGNGMFREASLKFNREPHGSD